MIRNSIILTSASWNFISPMRRGCSIEDEDLGALSVLPIRSMYIAERVYYIDEQYRTRELKNRYSCSLHGKYSTHGKVMFLNTLCNGRSTYIVDRYGDYELRHFISHSSSIDVRLSLFEFDNSDIFF